MSDPSKSAADDLLNIYWRHHAKWNMPLSLKDKRIAGEDLTQLANACCIVAEGILNTPAPARRSDPQTLKEFLKSQQYERRGQLWEERQRLVPLLEKVMAELRGDEWYYFWGLHQILNNLPQTLEEI